MFVISITTSRTELRCGLSLTAVCGLERCLKEGRLQLGLQPEVE